MTEPHSPRKNDHLVEPFYAGLESTPEQDMRPGRIGRVIVTLLVVALVGWLLFGG
jgi:hypothetical protein